MRATSILRFSLVGMLALGVAACGDDDDDDRDSGAQDSGGRDASTDSSTGDGGEDSFTFRTDGPSAYERVDRMGMPAVATALVTSKNEYNDADPEDDVANTFAGEIIASLRALHGTKESEGLDNDLTGADLVPCSMTGGLPECVTQTVGGEGSPTVASLILPDDITLNTSVASGFPNGRMLTDPVIDVTLAVILLDLHTNDQTPASLIGTNPTENDVEFSDEFPYLAEPQEPTAKP